MPKKFGINTKAADARDKKEEKKQTAKKIDSEKKEAMKWVEDDKKVLAKIERQKESELKKQQELERRELNRKLYEEEQSQFKSNKRTNETKVTRADIEKKQAEALKKTLEKSLGISDTLEKKPRKPRNEGEEDEDYSSDEDYRLTIEENINHILRDQKLEAEEKYGKVIDADNIDDALDQLGNKRMLKHPEKKVKAAYQDYIEAKMPEFKKDYPTLKRSQLLELINKEWKKAPENPFNQEFADFNEKV